MFSFAADRMRASDEDFAIRARMCETASRVAFLRAHLIAKREEIMPLLGETLRRAAFAVV
jgi:hypothetical protein